MLKYIFTVKEIKTGKQTSGTKEELAAIYGFANSTPFYNKKLYTITKEVVRTPTYSITEKKTGITHTGNTFAEIAKKFGISKNYFDRKSVHYDEYIYTGRRELPKREYSKYSKEKNGKNLKYKNWFIQQFPFSKNVLTITNIKYKYNKCLDSEGLEEEICRLLDKEYKKRYLVIVTAGEYLQYTTNNHHFSIELQVKFDGIDIKENLSKITPILDKIDKITEKYIDKEDEIEEDIVGDDDDIEYYTDDRTGDQLFRFKTDSSKR